jgi:hypothetical protein
MPHNKLATQLSDSPASKLAVAGRLAAAVAGGDSWQRDGWRRWPLWRQPVSSAKRGAGLATSSPHAGHTPSPASRGHGQSLARIMMPHNKLATQLSDSPASQLAVAAAAAGGDSWRRGGWRRWPLRRQPVSSAKRGAGRATFSPHAGHAPSPASRGHGKSLARIMMPHNKLATQLSDSPASKLAVAAVAAGGDSWQLGVRRRWPLRRQPVSTAPAGAPPPPTPPSPTSRGQGQSLARI